MPNTSSILCIRHLQENTFLRFDWMIMAREVSLTMKFKPPADLCKLHLAWGCYKLGLLFSLWCQLNGGCQEVRGLGNVSYQGWGSPLSWACAHGHRQKAAAADGLRLQGGNTSRSNHMIPDHWQKNWSKHQSKHDFDYNWTQIGGIQKILCVRQLFIVHWQRLWPLFRALLGYGTSNFAFLRVFIVS